MTQEVFQLSCRSLPRQFSAMPNLDQIIGKMNEFNIASRRSHAEILGLRDPEQGAPADPPQAARR